MFDFDKDRDQIVSAVNQIRAVVQSGQATEQELASALTLLQVAQPGGGNNSLGLPGFTVPIPMSPQVLTEMIYAASDPSIASKGVISESIAVPAGQTVTLTIPVIPGTVTLFTSGLKVTATYYDPTITADVILDGQNISPAPYQYAIVSEDTVKSILYTYITQYLAGTFINPTSSNTTITVKAEVLAVDQTLFTKQLWLPLMRKSLDVAKALAATYGTGA